MPFLDAYALTPNPPRIIPGRTSRPWMDNFTNRWAYRCLPMTVANASGWEILCPAAFEVEWNGGPLASDVTITPEMPEFVESHFACGTVTFKLGYLFRTSPEWAVWCRGIPNHAKHGISPLEGVIETDWLPYPFTMNWIMTAPGVVRFERDEPCCFVTLIRHAEIDQVVPRGLAIGDNPELEAEMRVWTESRQEFEAGDRGKDGWQKFYFKGAAPVGGGAGPARHVGKRKLGDVT